MRVLLSFDKFKDSMAAAEACDAAARGVREALPGCAIRTLPLADGGDGFVDVLARALGADLGEVRARDPLGREVGARIALVDAQVAGPALGIRTTGKIAIVEMAQASGLMRLAPHERDPMRTSSAGTGDMMLGPMLGAEAIVLGVGGSATNDLGIGALGVLGLQALDKAGRAIENVVPRDWPRIARFSWKRPPMPPLFIACDVANPLLGPNGATATFAPQKGLSRDCIADVDREAARIARLLCDATGADLRLADEPGSGAAGGIAFGLRAALGAKIVPGFDLFAACTSLDDAIAAADVVVVGEGRFDATSLQGKGPGEVVRRALAAGKRVVVACGAVEGTARRQLSERGVEAVALADMASSADDSMRGAVRLLAQAMHRVFAPRQVVRVASPAKINLHLDILRRRGDGFHDLATIFQAIDLEDELVVERAGGACDDLSIDGAPGLAADATNLVLRAAAMLRAEFGADRVPALRTRLVKRIPVQAGLGGGSSNAAAALVGINALLGLGLGESQLEERAARLGSDCAFFVRGGTAVGSGRGEVLASAGRAREFAVLLVVPDCTVPTGKAFGMLAPESLGARTDGDALLAWLAGGREGLPALHNTFEDPVRHAWPAIDETLRALAAAQPMAVLLSGSGAGCFALFADRGDAERAAEKLHVAARLVRTCSPLGRGVRVLE